MTLKREQITTTKSPNLYLNYLLAWICLPTSTFGGKKKALLPIYHLPSDLQSWHFYLLYWSCSPYCHQCLLIARFDGLFSVPTVSCASNIWYYHHNFLLKFFPLLASGELCLLVHFLSLILLVPFQWLLSSTCSLNNVTPKYSQNGLIPLPSLLFTTYWVISIILLASTATWILTALKSL